MKKKRLLSAVASLFLVVMVVLAGCSSNQASGGNHSGGTGKAGGTLTIAKLTDADNLDPQFITNLPSAEVVHHKVYETLVQQDKNMKFKPMLATEWKQVNDVTWEFKLREGVVFQDGTPFTAEAVKKTFDRVLDPEMASPRAVMFNMIKEIKVVDDHTVQFILNYPYASLLYNLASHEGSILSPKAIDEKGKELSRHPVGTGPFTFESWKSGQEIVLVKNKNYWGTMPKIDKVVFKVVPEDSTRINMVETGEAQVAENVPITDIDRIKASSEMALSKNDAYGVTYIGFNTKKKPLTDKRVRQAIAYAIETDAIIKGVYNNIGTKATSTMSPKVFGFNRNLKGYDYDINKAKKLLAEAGYPNGFKTTLWTNDNKERINLAEVVQSQLKGIGIDVKIQTMEYGAYLVATDKGEHDMFIGGWGNSTGDGDYNQFSLFHSKSFGSAGNQAFYSNPKVDKLIEDARKESDPEKRKSLYAQLQEIETEDAPLIPIRNSVNLAAVGKSVKGFWISPAGYVEINNTTIQ